MTRRIPYLPQLDGLRALAVFAVLVHHLPLGLNGGGYIGVDVFFVLSGYLITRILRQEVVATGTVSVSGFYVRRVRRLLPALVFFLAAIGVYWWLRPDAPAHDETVAAIPLSFVYAAGWCKALGVSLGALAHTWSLAVEEQFYLLWPLLVRRVRASANGLVFPTIVLFQLSTFLWYAGYRLGWSADRLVFGPDTRAKDLLAGCLLALALERWQPQRWPRFAGAGAVGLLAVWAYAVPKPSAWYMLGWPLVTGLSVVLIASLVVAPTTGTARVLAHRGLVWIGQRSYGIYLWHFPIYTINFAVADWSTDGRIAVGVLTTAASVAAAALSLVLVERPFMGSARPSVRWWWSSPAAPLSAE